jgi:MPBQ/MSBQ methyltransferase
VGCGIGGSARLLALHYGFDVLAISISPAQIARARALTCRIGALMRFGVWRPHPTCLINSAM